VTSAFSVLAALSAAISFAWAAILQQESAQAASEDKALKLSLLMELLRRPKWLVGVSLLVAGYVFQVVALACGPVALVQPLVVTELAFAVPLAMWRRHRSAGPREWAGISCVLAGISAFLYMASPESGNNPIPSGGSWLIVLVSITMVIASIIHLGSRLRGPARAVVLGAGAGLAFGVLAALTKSTTEAVHEGFGQILTNWQLYAVILVGIASLVLSQSAYQAGPLAYSMPVVAMLEPITAVALGAFLLDEQLLLHGRALFVELLAVIVATAGICLLATSRIVLSIYEEGRRPSNPHEPCGSGAQPIVAFDPDAHSRAAQSS
jgi:drug/metabolite transporter (DMT)-like permease